jgi:hypothetical protein
MPTKKAGEKTSPKRGGNIPHKLFKFGSGKFPEMLTRQAVLDKLKDRGFIEEQIAQLDRTV